MQVKDKMSVTQTFLLAHKARSKLSKEASRPDHDLRQLVLTANLLDSLMLHLSQAEEDQEAWFNGMVREGANHEEVQVKTPASLDAISEESESGWAPADYTDSESDSDSDDDDDEDTFPMLTIKSSSSSQGITSVTIEVEADSDEDEDEEDEVDDGFYSLQRMPSRAPSLIEDVSDSDDDESNPPSPRQSFAVPVLTEKERQNLVTTSFYEQSEEDSSPISYLDTSVHLRRSANLIAAF